MNYYNEIKQELINNEIYKKVKDYSKNRSDLNTYYNVGKLLVDAQGGEKRAKYGNMLIKEYSLKLTKELGKGYSERNLKNMRKFYLFQKGQPLVAELTWSNYVVLLSLKNIEEIKYYISQIIKYNLSKRELISKIKNKEYERLDDKTKESLIQNKKINTIESFIKEPIVIKNNLNKNEITEKVLKQLILEDIENFLVELGEGFTFIKSEYKIKLGDRYNYIDLLLFNYLYNCFVVVELKVVELSKEHIGQVQMYMNYIDRNIKTVTQSDTVGIIICKKNNEYVINYCSNPNIFTTTYEITNL